ncbi:hypothetical protein QBC46DRAFT_455849 [Diplogelasinospora grovesii]|uniref:ER transporter 6TM N-terminal domain-containing protein n=1 Tax=Diplogelasinospora grovesii TaxID=303347 RepID=A0AAN6NFD9_9PEZI|nr:hypothetical protein QBC46DRAFT_455849 [Diplogelasinospora grovesii]
MKENPWALPEWVVQLRAKLGQNHLWQRMTKHTIAVGVAFTIVVIPAVAEVFGPAAFLAPMVTVFGHSGQRLGQMVEALIFILLGAVIGMAWSTLGLYLFSLLYHTNEPAAYTIKAIFVLMAVLFHGYLRSQSPRLFVFLWIELLVTITTLLNAQTAVSRETATQIFYPLLTAFGVLLLVNVTVFPEYSNDFLGSTTIDTLHQTESAFKSAVEWFVEPPPEPTEQDGSAPPHEDGHEKAAAAAKPAQTRVARLAALTARKEKLRAKLAGCKKAYEECTFELSYSVLPPRSLKPIIKTAMSSFTRNVITLISACESKYVLTGAGDKKSSQTEEEDESSSAGSSSPASPSSAHGVEVSDDDMIGEEEEESETRPEELLDDRTKPTAAKPAVATLGDKINLARPRREIESGDAELLESLLSRVRDPLSELLRQALAAIELLVLCLACCYDVKRLPNGAHTPKGILLEEVDIRVEHFESAIASYDKSSMEALGKAASIEDADSSQVDIMPRIEIFLISSVLLSVRQAASQTLQMLKHARTLVERREARRAAGKRLYFPKKVNWKKWLSSDGDKDVQTLPQNARKEARTGKGTNSDKKSERGGANGDYTDDDSDALLQHRRNDEEAAAAAAAGEKTIQILQRTGAAPPPPPPPSTTKQQQQQLKRRQNKPGQQQQQQQKSGTPAWWRARGADLVESVTGSEHLGFAIKLAIAVFLVSWPAFYGPFNTWYVYYRAGWAPLQLVLVFEVAIGSSLWIFIVRAFGVVYGCVWGYLAYEIGRGHLVPLVIILILGVIPSAYVQLGTPYVKAGMIAIISMCIVALATVQRTGAAWENFTRRLIAFLVGGIVALIVEVAIYPVRARDRLVESLSSCITQISHMQASVATGIEHPERKPSHKRLEARFNNAKQKAQSALSAAETFLPFCLSEPRLKGSFKTLQPIYKEIIYVLHQIIDRMDNTISLRKAYGSSILEDLNPQVYEYRRNVAASVTLTLFAVDEALTTKLPLPQYLPSCRSAHVRLVHRVREVLQSQSRGGGASRRPSASTPGGGGGGHGALLLPGSGNMSSWSLNNPDLDEDVIKRATQPKFLSWNAAAAGQMEIIEYLEELVELTKLLVGVNAFRSGMLERPRYRNYARKARTMSMSLPKKRRSDSLPISTGNTEGERVNVLQRLRSAAAGKRRKSGATVGGGGGGGDGAVLEEEEEEEEEEAVEEGVAEEEPRNNGKEEGGGLLPPSLQRVESRFRQQQQRSNRRSSSGRQMSVTMMTLGLHDVKG